ncbi:hypothetical protein D3C84_1030120 [compost metagenome]
MNRNITKYEEENAEREKELKDFYEEQRQESKEREKNLMEHLTRSNESQEKTVATLEKIEVNLNNLEKRMDSGFNDVWDHLDQIEKKGNN